MHATVTSCFLKFITFFIPAGLPRSKCQRQDYWPFANSDSGGEHAAVLYSLIGTCRLNNVEAEKWLRYVIEHIQEWPANRVRDLLPWKVDLTSQ